MGALRLWAAYEDAAAGEFQSAEQLLNATPRDGVPPYYQALHDLARARVAVSTGEPGAALGPGGEVRRLLAQAEATVPNLTRSAELNRAYRRVLWTFLKRAGVRTPLFVYYKLFGPALLVVLVVGVGVAAGVWRSLGDK